MLANMKIEADTVRWKGLLAHGFQRSGGFHQGFQQGVPAWVPAVPIVPFVTEAMEKIVAAFLGSIP